jgi:hypothetical protein
MEGSMRLLKAVTIGMGVLILIGMTVVIVTIARRMTAPAPPHRVAELALHLDEPAGTRIAGIAGAGGRLAVQLQGGGVDRVVLVDPDSGAVTGRITLGR